MQFFINLLHGLHAPISELQSFVRLASVIELFLLMMISDSGFAINCGGPQTTSRDQVVYIWWGRSTASLVQHHIMWLQIHADGQLAIDSSDQQYQISNLLPITDTLDTNLFQTARISAGSLRYYGLGLENGNYTVRLQFVETVIGIPVPNRNIGRRVFDIYIQVSITL